MSALRDWDRGTTALAVDEVAARGFGQSFNYACSSWR